MMAKQKSDGFDGLRMAYEALVKAGAGSLTAAYNFGQVIDALSTFYTIDSMAHSIGRSPSTMSRYLRFFRHFPNLQAAQHLAMEIGSWDIGHLCAPEAEALGHKPHFGYRCNQCVSFDTKKTKRPE